jgi:hypothetical protein
MFITVLFIMTKEWKQPKFNSTNEWMNKMWYVHTMEYYLDTERNEVVIHVTAWVKVENTML